MPKYSQGIVPPFDDVLQHDEQWKKKEAKNISANKMKTNYDFILWYEI